MLNCNCIACLTEEDYLLLLLTTRQMHELALQYMQW